MNRETPILRAESVTLLYPGARRPSIAQFSLSLAAGERLVLVGESGAGKSTLVSAVAGLAPLVSGRLEVAGLPADGDSATLARLRRHLGLVLQSPRASLDPAQRIVEAVAEPLICLSRVPARAARSRAAELLEKLGIGEALLPRRPGTLSGGECQRVAVARALIHRPSLVLADEPTASLDPLVGAGLLETLAAAVVEANAAMVYVTHSLAEAETLGGQLAVLLAGLTMEWVEKFGGWEKVAHPYSRYLARAARAPVPPLDAAATGCPFRPRCDVALDICAHQVPETRETQAGHRLRCHARLT